jgi:hypothetical protein
MAVFWVVASCSLVEVYRRFSRFPYLRPIPRVRLIRRPDDGGSKQYFLKYAPHRKVFHINAVYLQDVCILC